MSERRVSPMLSLFTGPQDLPPVGSKVDQKRGHVTDSLNLLVSTVFQLEGHLWLFFSLIILSFLGTLNDSPVSFFCAIK